MARQKGGARVLGPYYDNARGRWMVVVVGGGGDRATKYFETEGEAKGCRRAAERKLAEEGQGERTVTQALDEYERHLQGKGNKPGGVAVTRWKLQAFFAASDLLDAPLRLVERRDGEKLYEAYRVAPTRTGEPPAVDTHRNTLGEARSFLAWCADKRRRWMRANPLASVEGIGRRRHGKAQLRIDEARAWLAGAIEHADAGEPGAVAAMMALLMNLRCSEIVARVTRDLDDEGKLLWIPSSKSEAGRRTLQVPEVVGTYLLHHAAGKRPEDLLLGLRDRATPRRWVQKICREVGVPVVTAHGMRGLHATLAVDAGATPSVVAAAMGHESFTVTARSYARAEAVESVRQRRALKVLAGGSK